MLGEPCGRKSLVLSGKIISRNREILIPDLRKKTMKKLSDIFIEEWIQGSFFFLFVSQEDKERGCLEYELN